MICFNPCSKIFVKKKSLHRTSHVYYQKEGCDNILGDVFVDYLFLPLKLIYYADYDGVILEVFKNNAVFIKHS